MTAPSRIIGDTGPVVAFDRETAIELWPAIRAHAVELRNRGATARLGRIAPTLQALQWLLEGFANETPHCAPSTNGAGSNHEPTTDAQTAADTLGVSVQHVRDLARRGDLNGRKLAGVWVIDVASVERHRDHNGGPG